MSKLFYKELSDKVLQAPLRVFHRNQLVGDFFAGIIVDGKIILDLKAVKSINPVAEAQLLNYLSISHLKVGYLFNFRNTFLAWKKFITGNG
ncbi:MAG: GxxExxY protein [Spirochaetia bacterium]|jgi:GxxExxY protein|nr:GxxExxY protein [Spirochaetia bacterium]